MKYGLLGEKLGHSFSKEIHELLRAEPYELCELTREELDHFLRKREFLGVNVTIPYKQTVIPYLDGISEEAKRIGAVNTIVCKDGKLFGDNTDYLGFRQTLVENHAPVLGAKCLVLGNGGAAKAVSCALEDLGAASLVTVKYKPEAGCCTYEEAAKLHADATILVNTSPVGMYPKTDCTPLSLAPYTSLCTVCDLIYNPTETLLLKEAASRQIQAVNGLRMLFLQALASSEAFFGDTYDKTLAKELWTEFLRRHS